MSGCFLSSSTMINNKDFAQFRRTKYNLVQVGIILNSIKVIDIRAYLIRVCISTHSALPLEYFKAIQRHWHFGKRVFTGIKIYQFRMLSNIAKILFTLVKVLYQMVK